MNIRSSALSLLAVSGLAVSASGASLVIKGLVDGPLSLDGNGGDPKALVFEVTTAIADLSIYGVGVANNGGGSDGIEFTFPAIAAAVGDILVITSHATHETYLNNNFATISASYVDFAAGINGDDPVELFESGVVIDVYGDVALDGTGESWDHLDSYAYRTDLTAKTTFDLAQWTVAPTNTLDGLDAAQTATAIAPLFAPVPEPTTSLLGGIALLGLLIRRRG